MIRKGKVEVTETNLRTNVYSICRWEGDSAGRLEMESILAGKQNEKEKKKKKQGYKARQKIILNAKFRTNRRVTKNDKIYVM